MKHLPLLISLAIAMPAVAQSRAEDVLPEMKVIVTAIGDGYRPAADTALMLSSTPGYSVAAGGGTAPYTYTWYRNGAPLAGAPCRHLAHAFMNTTADACAAAPDRLR